MGSCDCDECGNISVIPAPIQDAIDRYKRRKIETGPLKRTQDRSLVKRDLSSNIAVWQWTLPQDAEPLLEFGKSHRIVWIKQLPGKLYSIGQGIVGSQAEEKLRKVMDWNEGNFYFVPSTGGRAVGWIHKAEAAEDKEPKGVGGLADAVIAKVPAACVESDSQREDDDAQSWHNSLVSLCRKYDSQTLTEGGFVTISSEEDIECLKSAMS